VAIYHIVMPTSTLLNFQSQQNAADALPLQCQDPTSILKPIENTGLEEPQDFSTFGGFSHKN